MTASVRRSCEVHAGLQGRYGCVGLRLSVTVSLSCTPLLVAWNLVEDIDSAVSEFCAASDHFKIAHTQEHALPLHHLTMLNSAVSSVQHQITLRLLTLKNMYYLLLI